MNFGLRTRHTMRLKLKYSCGLSSSNKYDVDNTDKIDKNVMKFKYENVRKLPRKHFKSVLHIILNRKYVKSWSVTRSRN